MTMVQVCVPQDFILLRIRGHRREQPIPFCAHRAANTHTILGVYVSLDSSFEEFEMPRPGNDRHPVAAGVAPRIPPPNPLLIYLLYPVVVRSGEAF